MKLFTLIIALIVWISCTICGALTAGTGSITPILACSFVCCLTGFFLLYNLHESRLIVEKRQTEFWKNNSHKNNYDAGVTKFELMREQAKSLRLKNLLSENRVSKAKMDCLLQTNKELSALLESVNN